MASWKCPRLYSLAPRSKCACAESLVGVCAGAAPDASHTARATSVAIRALIRGGMILEKPFDILVARSARLLASCAARDAQQTLANPRVGGGLVPGRLRAHPAPSPGALPVAGTPARAPQGRAPAEPERARRVAGHRGPGLPVEGDRQDRGRLGRRPLGPRSRHA